MQVTGAECLHRTRSTGETAPLSFEATLLPATKYSLFRSNKQLKLLWSMSQKQVSRGRRACSRGGSGAEGGTSS